MGSQDAIAAAKDCIRNPFAWPGGYPKYIFLEDGELICNKCARAEWRNMLWSTKHDLRDGWGIAGASIVWESEHGEYCSHCGTQLETAYGTSGTTST